MQKKIYITLVNITLLNMIFKQKMYSLSLSLISSQGFDSFPCGIIQVRSRDDCQARILNDLLSIVNVGPLQTDHQWDLERGGK